MRKQLQTALKIVEAMDEYTACEGCDECPFNGKCKGIDDDDCYINNALTNLSKIVKLPDDELQPLLDKVQPLIEWD